MFLKGMVAQCAILLAYIYRENTSIQTLKCFTDVNESWLERNSFVFMNRAPEAWRE